MPQVGSKKDRDGLGRLSTAQDVLDGIDLSGMTFFVSGGNSGIGCATACTVVSRRSHAVSHHRAVRVCTLPAWPKQKLSVLKEEH